MGIAVTSGLALLFFVLFFCQCRKSREGTLFYTHHNHLSISMILRFFDCITRHLSYFLFVKWMFHLTDFHFWLNFVFMYTFLTKRKPWSLQYNTRNDRIFRCSAPREASCSCTRGQWRNQFIPVSNQGHVNHMIFLKKYFHVGTFFRIQKCIHMHEQCNSFLQKVYFLKIVYTMSCDSYL